MKTRCLAILLLSLSPVSLWSQGFDTPIRKKVLDLGPSPYYSKEQRVRIMRLLPKSVTKTVAGPVKCWPVD